MVEAFFGFEKTPFADNPDPKQLFPSPAWNQAKARLQFLADHHDAGLLTGEVGSGKSTAARTLSAALNPNLDKNLYLHWTPGSTLDLLRQLALELDLEPARYRGDLVRQISQAIVRLNQIKKQHPILICDEAQLLCHSALEELPLLLNFDMDSSRYLTVLLVGHLDSCSVPRRCSGKCPFGFAIDRRVLSLHPVADRSVRCSLVVGSDGASLKRG